VRDSALRRANVCFGGKAGARVVARWSVFTPEIVRLPDAWPACRRAQCRSTAAVACAEAPYGPVVITCENGHFRAYRKKSDFRRGARYAGLFSESVVAAEPSRERLERLLEPAGRRRSEVLEDAERCALCGTPPAEHPFRPELDLQGDRELWTWLQRWRPAVYAQLREVVAIAGQRERVTFANWRSAITPRLREILVREMSDSALETDHVVPVERLAHLAGALPPGELAFAVNRLLIAVCRTCADARRLVPKTREDYVRDYVVALYGGDERLARADAAAWRTMESIASQAARVRLATDERSA
jgi:hypothetical protein